MALRLLPFRQYAEQDVINMYALQKADINEGTQQVGSGDAGIWVKVTQGGLDNGPTTYDDVYKTYLGMDPGNVPYVGRDQYPRVVTEVGVAASGDSAIGVTLYQTAQEDENGQKLLYYPQKKLETQSVLPGESVPVLSRGIITVPASIGVGAVNGGNGIDLTPAGGDSVIGSGITLKQDVTTTQGQAEVSDPSAGFGRILATGSRVVNSGQNMDQFAGDPAKNGGASTTGFYAIVQFDSLKTSV